MTHHCWLTLLVRKVDKPWCGKNLPALILAVILTHLRHSLKGYWTVGHWPCCQCGRRRFTLSTNIRKKKKNTMNNSLPSWFQLSLPHVPLPSCGGDLAFATCLGFQFAGHRFECSKLTPPPSNFFGQAVLQLLCANMKLHYSEHKEMSSYKSCFMIHVSSLSPPSFCWILAQGTPVNISRIGFIQKKRAPLSGAWQHSLQPLARWRCSLLAEHHAIF